MRKSARNKTEISGYVGERISRRATQIITQCLAEIFSNYDYGSALLSAFSE